MNFNSYFAEKRFAEKNLIIYAKNYNVVIDYIRVKEKHYF